jgi:Spy/CpxP family protein refolding chaperone
MASNPDMRSQMPQGAGPHGSMHRQHQAAAKGGSEGPMGQIPQAVIDQLALAPAQQAQFASAQAARKEMQASKQSLRAEQRKAMDEQLTKDIVDPRAVMAQQKKMRTTMEAKMELVQQKWLAFWDGLSAPQKTTLSNYMKSKHAEHTQKKPAAAKG